ncbi:MAG: hypothetical protein QM783_12480 [Phycisphaerales bacterium]
MRCAIRSFAVITPILALTAASFGQVTLVSQSRSIDPNTIGPAAGFGPYADSASISNQMFNTAASASQTSDLSITGATFHMGASGTGSGSHSTSLLTFTFNALPGVMYTLDGTGDQGGGPGTFVSGSISISLIGPGVNDHETITNFHAVSIHTLGTLSGGEYTLTISVQGFGTFQQGSPRTGSAFFDGALTLTPTPGAAALLALAAIPTSRRRR